MWQVAVVAHLVNRETTTVISNEHFRGAVSMLMVRQVAHWDVILVGLFEFGNPDHLSITLTVA